MKKLEHYLTENSLTDQLSRLSFDTAILVNCAEELLELEVSELKAFLQHLPVLDMDQVISQAYVIRDEIRTNNL